tara:strand:- start:1948 stop:2187 length:240 start_codon:yes stop_codon:yes gene_type:complete
MSDKKKFEGKTEMTPESKAKLEKWIREGAQKELDILKNKKELTQDDYIRMQILTSLMNKGVDIDLNMEDGKMNVGIKPK